MIALYVLEPVQNPCTPELILNEPVPLRTRLVTPIVAVSPLYMPAKPIGLFTDIVRALIPAVPAGKPAAAVGSHTTGVAVRADVVAHCGVVVSHVPLVGAERPLGSQKKTVA